MKSLESIAAKRGLTVVGLAQGHYQIVGGSCIVNYYPHSKRRSAYISGAEGKGKRNVTPERAVEMAFEPAPAGWSARRETRQDLGEPSKRTPAEWTAILPNMRFASKRTEETNG